MTGMDRPVVENLPNTQETSSLESSPQFSQEQFPQDTPSMEIATPQNESIQKEEKKFVVEPTTKEMGFNGAGNTKYIQEYLPNFESYQEVIDKKKEVDGTLGLMLLSKKIKGDIPTID